MNVTNKYIENPQLALSVNTNSLGQHRNSSNGGSTAVGTSDNKHHFSGSETLARQQPPASASMKGIANVAAAAASNYRQVAAAASSKDSYHLQLLNKENKALQNLLAAVELNRTSGGGAAGNENNHPPIKNSAGPGVMMRSTQMGSAKQQQHLQNLLHQQQMQQQQLQAARDHYQSHREFGRDLSNNGASQNNNQAPQQPQPPTMVHPILSTKAAISSVQQASQQMNNNAPSSGNNISIFKNFISQYQSNTNGVGLSTKNANNPSNNTSTSNKLELTQSAVLASATNASGKAQTINRALQQQSHLPHPHPVHHPHHHHHEDSQNLNRAQTSQAIKSFDGPAQNAAVHQQQQQAANANNRTQSSSTYHHTAKAFISNAGNSGGGVPASAMEPIRRKTTTAASLHHQQQRRTGVELVKIGQKLTSENVNGNKGNSFIAEESNNNINLTIVPNHGQNNMQNAQSSANLHSSNAPMAPVISVKPQTTTNMNAQPVLLSRPNLSSANQPLILPKPSSNGNQTLTPNYLMNSTVTSSAAATIQQQQQQLQGYTSSRMTGSTNSGGMHSLSHTLHSKLNNNSKSNLHAGVGTKHIVIEDKENRRDMVNRQSQQLAGGMLPAHANNAGSGPQPQMQQNSSSTSLLKRSKTSDPNRGMQVVRAAAATSAVYQQQAAKLLVGAEGLTQQSNLAAASIHLPQLQQPVSLQANMEAPQQQLLSSQQPLVQLLPQIQPLPEPQDSSPTSSMDLGEQRPALSQAKMDEVARLMEERRKERMKTLTRNLEVCDLLDIRNPQSVAEFAPQIYRYLHQEELNHMYPQEFLISNQTEITEKMRAYLIDWLSELHLKFKLWPETLYVCTGIIDKYIMLQPDIKKKDLQCLGITALHIAGKYEEIYPPELKQILRVTDNAVAKDEVLALEFKILQALDFSVTFPSILRFMERYARIAQVQERTQILAQYLCDTCLLDCTLMKERPSKLAAVCLYAAMRLAKGMNTGGNNLAATAAPALFWNATLTKNTGYKEEEVRGMALDLIKFVRNVETSSLQSLYKKYSSARFLEAAKLLQQNGGVTMGSTSSTSGQTVLQQQ